MKLPKLTQAPPLRLWLPYFVMGITLTMLIYTSAQQNLRQGANDPQIQMAEDTATALASGEPVSSLVPSTKVNMRTSLAPFLIVLDENLNVVSTSGTLDGQIVRPPKGTFEAARDNAGKDVAPGQPGENRVTWQANDQARIAAVIVHYDGGYVVAGRSLREVENREQGLAELIGAALLGLLAAGLVLLVVIR